MAAFLPKGERVVTTAGAMETLRSGKRAGWALAGSCGAIFWPGAFIFSLPGVLGETWQSSFGVGRAAVGRSMFFVLAAVGIFMFVVGRLQERTGPGPLVAIGGLLCGFSTLFLGGASSMAWVYVWAFLVGAASAFIYLPALTVVQEWYPDRRGLVSGSVNLAFGLSAAVMAPLFSGLLRAAGPETMTMVFGAIAVISGLAVVPAIRRPEAGPATRGKANEGKTGFPKHVTVSESLRTRAFWCLWSVWALAGAAGISMVTLSTAFGAARGLSLQEAVVLLTAFNLTNGGSRLVSGYLSDRFGRRYVMGLSFAAAGLAYWGIPMVRGLVVWSGMAAVVGFAFGTLFSVSAPLASDRFGLRHFGSIFGLIFTAYGFVAGPLGPWLSGFLLDIGGEAGFHFVFGYLGLCFFLSALLIQLVGPVPSKGPEREGTGGSLQ